MKKLRIGTRGSRLALTQANIIRDLIKSINPAIEPEIVTIKTIGDMKPPSEKGGIQGKFAFTKEIDEKLLSGDIDIAVHSMKDLPNELNPELEVIATPKRGDPRDALISINGRGFYELPAHARIGTSSIRRKVQLLSIRRDIEIVELHGNVDTRIRRMREKGLDGIVLAASGLERIGMSNFVSQFFPVDEIVPAVCQGIIAVEARRGDDWVKSVVANLNDEPTYLSALCERAFSSKLGLGCNLPIGAYAEVDGGNISIIGMISNPNGERIIKRRLVERLGEPEKVGERLADVMLNEGGMKIIEEVWD